MTVPTDAPTPLFVARELLQHDSRHEGAQLVCAPLRRGLPWSTTASPRRGCARGVKLLVLGHLLARERPELIIAGRAFVDVWAEHVMPHALARDEQ
jgi:hypothetical protein